MGSKCCGFWVFFVFFFLQSEKISSREMKLPQMFSAKIYSTVEIIDKNTDVTKTENGEWGMGNEK